MQSLAPIRTVRITNQHDLALAVHGWSDQGDPLLLVHGFGLSARVWDFVVPRLIEGNKVLGLDARGHGESQYDPQFRYHHINLGRDIASVLDALSIDSATLVAHSTAGHAAIGYAARFPERVRALVLIEAGAELPRRGSGGVSPETRENFASPAEFETELGDRHPLADPRVLHHLAAHWIVEQPDGRWVRKLDPAFYRPRSARDPEHRRSFDRAAWAEKEESGLWSDLARIACPTLVVRGERTRRFSRATQAKMVSDVIPRAEGLEIAGAGHNVMLDRPQALAEAIADFLARAREPAQ
jgi:esterase